MVNLLPNAITRLVVENTSSRPLTFVLEPWANEYPMAPGERFVLEGDGPTDDAGFYVEQCDDYLVAWAWEGADARILREDGIVVEDWTGLRFPPFPRARECGDGSPDQAT